ncbi:MAG: LppP/LprE family lipoprotein [Solirubrobacteraceae bacterium]
MRHPLLGAIAAATLSTCGVAVLGGCGSQTKTVSATDEAAVTQPSTATTKTSSTVTTTPTTTTSTATTPTQSTTNGGTSAPTITHTASEPAFTRQETHGEGASAAAELVRARGYTPNNTSEYHSNQTLRVLVGTRTGSTDGYGQQAFFFLGGRYIGTDTKEPSATVKVLAQSDTEVTLVYSLYRSGDPLSSPSGGQATVRFQLNNGKLTPVGNIPPVSSRN